MAVYPELAERIDRAIRFGNPGRPPVWEMIESRKVYERFAPGVPFPECAGITCERLGVDATYGCYAPADQRVRHSRDVLSGETVWRTEPAFRSLEDLRSFRPPRLDETRIEEKLLEAHEAARKLYEPHTMYLPQDGGWGFLPGYDPQTTQIYPDEKMERLYRGSLRVLRETGFFIDHDLLLGELERRGMKVDRSRRRAFITEDLVRDLLAPDPDRHALQKEAEAFPASFGVGGSYPRVYDWPTRSSRRGNSASLLDLVRVFGSIEGFSHVGRVLTLSDAPAAIEPIVATALVAKHSPRPAGGEVYKASNIPYLVELGEIVTGRAGCTDFVPSCTFVVPPLKMTRDEGDLIVEKGRRHIRAVAGTMPSSGATAPVTREGTIVVELAEIIGIWICYLLVDPEIELGTISASSILDMREGTCSFSAPEAVIQDCATSQICRRYFGARAGMSSGYVDAKVPGIQATHEKLFKAWWSHQFLGSAPYAGGLLQAGQSFSAAQALLEWDMWESINALFRGEPDVADQIPFDDIHEVASMQGSFLGTDHTIRLFRDVLHHPTLLDRSPRRSDEEEARKSAELLDRAQASYEAYRRSAPEYQAPEAVCRAVDEVVERARRELL